MPTAPAAKPAVDSAESASDLITGKIAALGDWRGTTLERMRTLIHQAAPDVIETWKWRGTPVWELDGIICTGETYKNVVKLTFARGACLNDPKHLFNSSLDGNVRRALDIKQGESVDRAAFQALILEAIAANKAAKAKPAKKPKT